MLTEDKMINKDVIQIIENQLGLDPGSLELKVDLIENLGAASIDLTEIVMRLEKHFQIQIEELDSVVVENIINLIESKCQISQ
jgi:acyl carrier protein